MVARQQTVAYQNLRRPAQELGLYRETTDDHERILLMELK